MYIYIYIKIETVKNYLYFKLTSGKKCWGNLDLSLVEICSIFPENICLFSPSLSSQP